MTMDQNMILPESRIFTSLEAAVEWRKKLREYGQRLAVTNGCFDILHRGHAEYLLAARRTADVLLVLINSDESVRALKGAGRPINTAYDRAYLLASLRCVDAYAKGGDYTFETLNPEERAVLVKHHVKVHFIPFVPDHSTTLILKKAGKA